METKEKLFIRKTRTGVGKVVFSAWEKATEQSHSHTESNGSPLQAFDRGVPIIGSQVQLLGMVGTRKVPPDIAAMAAGVARYQAWAAFTAGEYKRAVGAIVAEYPEAQGGHTVGAEVHLLTPEPAIKVKAFLIGKHVEVELAGETPLQMLVQEAFAKRLEDGDIEEGRAFIPRRIVLQPRGSEAMPLGGVPIALIEEIEGPGWWLAIECEETQAKALQPTPAGAERACALCGCTDEKGCEGGCAWMVGELAAALPDGLRDKAVCTRCAGEKGWIEL